MYVSVQAFPHLVSTYPWGFSTAHRSQYTNNFHLLRDLFSEIHSGLGRILWGIIGFGYRKAGKALSKLGFLVMFPWDKVHYYTMMPDII